MPMERLLVIKIGGNIIDNDEKLSLFLREFVSVPGKKILVHGGGKLATKLADQLGHQQQMVEGRRITDSETLKIVTMVYAGYINKTIVAELQKLGLQSIASVVQMEIALRPIKEFTQVLIMDTWVILTASTILS